MEAFAAEGKAKALGVSNFTAEQLTHLMASAVVMPAVNQVPGSVPGDSRVGRHRLPTPTPPSQRLPLNEHRSACTASSTCFLQPPP